MLMRMRSRLRIRQEQGTTGILLLVVGVIAIAPVLMLIYTSFRSAPPGSPAAFTLSNWSQLASSSDLEELRNTILIALFSSLVAVPTGAFFAWLETQTDAPLAKAVNFLVLVPLVFSPLLTTIAWTVLAGPRSGVINVWIRDWSGIQTFFNVYSMGGMVLISSLYFVPVAYLTLRGPMSSIDGSVIEAARVSGARTPVVLTRVLLPLLSPAIGAATLLTFTLNVGLFAVTTILGPTSQVQSLQLDAYLSMTQSPPNPTHAAALAVVVLALSLISLTIHRRFLVKPGRFVTLGGRGARSVRVRLGHWRWACLAIGFVYICLAVVLPYLALVYGSFVPYISSTVSFHGWGLENFRTFWSQPDMVTGVWNSVKLVVAGAAITTAVAVLVGYLVRRVNGPLARGLEAVATLPAALPGLSYALGFLWLSLSFGFGREYLDGSLVLIYLAQFGSFLPVAVQIIASGTVQLSTDLEHAGRVFGAGAVTRMRRIVLPALRPTVASAWLLVALHTSTESGMSVFLYSQPSVTMAVNVFNSSVAGALNAVYAGAFLLATFGLVTILVGNRLFRAANSA